MFRVLVGRLVHAFALHELGAQRQLVRSQTHGFSSVGRRYSFHLKQDLARPYDRDPVVRRAFAFAHTGFSRLLGDRLVREQPDPDFATALDEARHGDAAGLNLTVGDPARLHDLQAEIAERQFAAAPRLAAHAPALLLAVLHFLWHQHSDQP